MIPTRNRDDTSATPPARLTATRMATRKNALAAPASQIGTVKVPAAASTPGITYPLSHWAKPLPHPQIFRIMAQRVSRGYHQSQINPNEGQARLVATGELSMRHVQALRHPRVRA